MGPEDIGGEHGNARKHIIHNRLGTVMKQNKKIPFIHIYLQYYLKCYMTY